MMDRREFLKRTALASAAVSAGPVLLELSGSAPARAAARGPLPFVDDYLTNTTANLTPESNAAVRILGGMADVWQTGPTWDTGTVKAADLLRANIRYCERVTRRRTDAEARLAFIHDRQHQSYAVIAGLGPLTGAYLRGSRAVTGITSAPDTTPATTISDTLPADAPAGSALGAGAPDSALGSVVQLVNTLRGAWASSNPGKLAYQYPRPWRMTTASEVVPTGRTDALGYPVYDSDVRVAVQLLRQRSTNPAEDGGYPSGHANAFFLAGLALAYAVPERFQEILTRVFELSESRIVAGMHSPVDVIGGRILATALAAAALHDPRFAELKAAARAQALAYLNPGRALADADPATDPYADRERNRASVAPKLTYGLPRQGPATVPMTVPKGAEVLLETRLPYLSADQRREVLRTTALPSGHALLDGPELWGRLDLFRAADGYGALDTDVTVTMDAAAGGFAAADTWRNDIGGRGALTKAGSGILTVTGDNDFSGGTAVRAGILAAAAERALGRGDVTVWGGTLAVTVPATVRNHYVQKAGGTLSLTVGAPLEIDRDATLEPGTALVLTVPDAARGRLHATVPVLSARRLTGTFATITADGHRVEPVYSRTGLAVRLVPLV